MYYLPEQKKWFKRRLVGAVVQTGLWALIGGIIIGVYLGFTWCYKVNVIPCQEKIERLKTDINRGSFTPERKGK